MFFKGFKIYILIFFSFSINLLINYQVYANELKFTKIINLNSPWGMTFKNEKELIISEQTGKLVYVKNGEFIKINSTNELKEKLIQDLNE